MFFLHLDFLNIREALDELKNGLLKFYFERFVEKEPLF